MRDEWPDTLEDDAEEFWQELLVTDEELVEFRAEFNAAAQKAAESLARMAEAAKAMADSTRRLADNHILSQDTISETPPQ